MRERAALEREAYDLGLRESSVDQTESAAPGGPNLGRAIGRNRTYSRSLGWGAFVDRIVSYLGYVAQTPDEIEFARAIARWQSSQGLPADGVLGPATWQRLAVGLDPTLQPAARVRSGAAWVQRFPGSKSVDDLEPAFRERVRAFLGALDKAK